MSKGKPFVDYALGLFLASAPVLGYAETDQKAIVEVRVDTSKPKPWLRRLHGFNTNLISGLYGYGDAEFRRQTSRLKPTLLRFPGGTVGNFYHWRKRGFTARDMVSTASERHNKRNLRNLALLQKRRDGIVDFDAFMGLCKDLDAQAIVVVNVFTGTPEESAAWVQYVKESGYEISGWELGNELYLPFYRNRFPSVDVYVKEARRHAVAMRAVDSGIRLAVPAHPLGFHLHRSSRHAHHWNQRLAAATFYDAYVVHTYLRPHKYLDNEQISQLDATRSDLFALSEASFRQAASYYPELFGNREIWLTEWNLAEKGDRVIADTLLHALYVGDFLIQLIESDLPITAAGYHTLGGRWNGFPAFTPTDEDVERATSSVRRASYHAFELLAEPFAQATKRYSLTLGNASNLSNHRVGSEHVSAISAAAFGGQDTLFTALVNRSGRDIRVRLITNGREATGSKAYHVLSASRLNARGKKKQLTVERRTLEGPVISIPANSFGVIEAQ